MSLYGDKVSIAINAGQDRISINTTPGIDNLVVTSNFEPAGDPQIIAPLLNENGMPLQNENGDILYTGN